MKSEIIIRDRIKTLTKDYWHVLDCYPASVPINSPRSIMQTIGRTHLDALYWVLGEKRPRFKCDDFDKLDY